MAHKRSREAYESGSRKPTYVVCGTPLPPLDSEARDDGSYVPLWQQTVTDERGRKRLHGAFTGGFSAGYFNTVGSKEGWTPATFVSSRSNRNQNATAQRPEDFMDTEDLVELNESQQLQTTASFAGLGASQSESILQDDLFGLAMGSDETMGVKLLQKMGWRRGQGIGPKIRRTARLDDEEAFETQHLFAPADTQVVTFDRKQNRHGLGFDAGPTLVRQRASSSEPLGDKAGHDLFPSPAVFSKPSLKRKAKTGFGVGVLNDDSDDDDPYEMGPRITLNRALGRKPKKSLQPRPGLKVANPSVKARPKLVSRKQSMLEKSSRRCHDGRHPLAGFILWSQDFTVSQHEYPPPTIPPGWQPKKKAVETQSANSAPVSLDPAARGSMLGEAPLPGRSIFTYMSKESQDRIKDIIGNRSRFVSAGQGGNAAPSASRTDPAEEAAKAGLYGSMTRSSFKFTPSPLLCKRFNMKQPE